MLQKKNILISVCNPSNVNELGGPARLTLELGGHSRLTLELGGPVRLTLVIHKYETYYRLSNLLLSIPNNI